MLVRAARSRCPSGQARPGCPPQPGVRRLGGACPVGQRFLPEGVWGLLTGLRPQWRPSISRRAASARKAERVRPRAEAAASMASSVPLSRLMLARTTRLVLSISGTAMRKAPSRRSSAAAGANRGHVGGVGHGRVLEVERQRLRGVREHVGEGVGGREAAGGIGELHAEAAVVVLVDQGGAVKRVRRRARGGRSNGPARQPDRQSRTPYTKLVGRARRNGALAPFHLIFTLFDKYIWKYTSRDISSAHVCPPAVRLCNFADLGAGAARDVRRRLQ